MADQEEQDVLLHSYPKLGSYIRAARRRGYSDADIDAAISQGIAERRKAGQSIEVINSEFGITQEPTRGERIQSVLGKFAAGEMDILGREYDPSKSILGPASGQAASDAFQAGEGPLSIAKAGVGAHPALQEATAQYKTGTQAAVVDAPRALADKTGVRTPFAYAESVGRGLTPGLDTNVNYTEAYGPMPAGVDEFLRTTAWKGIPIPAAAVPFAEKFAAQTLGRAGKVGQAGAVAADMATISPADFTGAVGDARLARTQPGTPPPTAFPDVDFPAVKAGGERTAVIPQEPMLEQFRPVRGMAVDTQVGEVEGVFKAGVDNLPTSPRRAVPNAATKRHARALGTTDPIEQFYRTQELERTRQMREGLAPGERPVHPREPIPNEQALALRPQDDLTFMRGIVAQQQPQMPRRSVGAAGTGKGAEGQDIYGPMKDKRFVKYDDSHLPPRPPGERGLAVHPTTGIPFHSNRAPARNIDEVGEGFDIPRSQALAKVPGQGVVDSTRTELANLGGDAAVAGGRDRFVVNRPVDAQGNHLAEEILGPGKTTNPDRWGQLNPAAFPDRLPMGDRQGVPPVTYKDAGEGKFQYEQPGARAKSSVEVPPDAGPRIGGETGPAGAERRAREEAAKLSDLTSRLDELDGKFHSFGGDIGAEKAIASVLATLKKFRDSFKQTPQQAAMRKLIASFQRKKGRTINGARQDVAAWTREIAKGLKEGKLSAEEAKAGAEAVKKIVTDTVAAQNRIHRQVLIRAARKVWGKDVLPRDIKAAAGEVDALSEGLALSRWQEIGDWVADKARSGVGLFKTVKVLGSTTAYANNVGSNLISGYFAGLSPKDIGLLSESIKDLRANGTLTQQAINAGLFGTEFFSKDLDTLLRELELAAKESKSAAEMLESFWRRSTGKAAAAYDGIDKVFKLATFAKATSKGVVTGANPFGGATKLDARAAVEHINLYFPNYERLGPGLQRFRKATTTALTVNPFLAFPLEYARIYKNAAANKPFHLAAGVAAVGGLAAAGEMATGVDRPSYHRLPSKLAVPIPFTRDSRGEPRFVDLTYMVPLADTFSQFKYNPGKSWASQLVGSAKAPESGLLSAAVSNVLTRGIISPADEKFKKPGEPGVFGSAKQLAMNPSIDTAQQLLRAQPVPFGQKLGGLGNKRAQGEDPGLARELGEFAGVRMLPDSRIEHKRAQAERKGRERDYALEISRVKNDRSLTREERLQRMAALREEAREYRRANR